MRERILRSVTASPYRPSPGLTGRFLIAGDSIDVPEAFMRKIFRSACILPGFKVTQQIIYPSTCKFLQALQGTKIRGCLSRRLASFGR